MARLDCDAVTRERITRNRRAADIVTLSHDRMKFHVTFSRYDDGRIAEVFIKAGKPGSPVEAWARDSGLLLSMAIQYGVPLGEMLKTITKLEDGVSPAGGLGMIIQYLADEPIIPPHVPGLTVQQQVDATTAPTSTEPFHADSSSESLQPPGSPPSD